MLDSPCAAAFSLFPWAQRACQVMSVCWLCVQVDAAVAPFVLRLKVLEGMGDYRVPQGEPHTGSASHTLTECQTSLRVHSRWHTNATARPSRLRGR